MSNNEKSSCPRRADVGKIRLAARKAFVYPIKLYKKFISPLLGQNCRYYPTCSRYMSRAVMTHGVVKGFILGVWRILRCNPWAKGGYDPVPPPGKWTNRK